MLLIKLGGSVITNKERECTFLEKRTRRLVEELRYISEPMIVTHGAGSFGHKRAGDYRLKEGFQNDINLDQMQGFSIVQNDVRRLNNQVIEMMNKFDIKGVSVPTSAVVTYTDLKLAKMDFSVYNKVLMMGSVPVGFGDVVFDTKRVFAICSADDLMVHLAKRFKPSRAVFVTDVDGLFGADPDEKPTAPLITEVRSEKDIPKRLKVSHRKKDVTGGMVKKAMAAMEIARSGVEVIFVNGGVDDRVLKALKGKDVVGTRFFPMGQTRSRRPSGQGGKRR
jgi:isopentenyl phosphate kinase